MRLEDNMMPVLTGLIFAVVLGTTVQNSEGLMSAFGASTAVQADNDVFLVRAGARAELDVLANDRGADLSGADIKIMSQPACGEITTNSTGITYFNSETCEGELTFSYCLPKDSACNEAEVAMRVRPLPVTVADNKSLPGEDGLVPLDVNASSAPAPAARPAVPQVADGSIQLQAFAAVLAPPPAPEAARLASHVAAILDLRHTPRAADIAKAPISDPDARLSLDPANVPLSAVRTSLFLPEHAGAIPSDDTQDGESIAIRKVVPAAATSTAADG